MNVSSAHLSVHRRLKWLLVLLACVGLAAILFRKPIQQAVLLRSLLMSDSASEPAFLALVDGAKDRFALLQRIWNRKKIPHRALVVTYLKDNAGARPDSYRRDESLLLSATMDADAPLPKLKPTPPDWARASAHAHELGLESLSKRIAAAGG